MNFPSGLKRLCKLAVLLIAVLVFRPLLDMLVILKFHLGPLLADRFGYVGFVFMLGIEIIIIPLLLVIFVGIIGGLWIGGKAINGFILSMFFYLFGFIIEITTLGLKLDWITFLLFLGLIIVPAVGTLIYDIFSKRVRMKSCEVTAKTST